VEFAIHDEDEDDPDEVDEAPDGPAPLTND
jgi:hypothetical protein